jgi:hypothetical protein
MAKIRVIRKATRSFRLGQMLFKTRTREIELQILPGATQRHGRGRPGNYFRGGYG